MICWAMLWGMRGSPKPSASRMTSRENTGRRSGANHRVMNGIRPAVTMTSAMTMPRTLMPAPMTSHSLTAIVAIDRANVSTMNCLDFS